MIFMAIQLPDVGTGVPADKTGDSPWLAMKKVRENFNDQTNAASKLVGTAAGQIPLSGNIPEIVGMRPTLSRNIDIDTLTAGAYNIDMTSTVLPWGDRYAHIFHFDTIQSGYAIQISFPNIHVYPKSPRYRIKSAGEWQPWNIFYNTGNTTKDANGFLKAASPIVKVFADKAEFNGEAEDQNVAYKKNGIGDYTITTVSGLSTDGWYIELPKDMNGNPKVAVTLSEVDGVISLKTYKRIFSMETFTFEPDLDNPLDVPDTRWIDLRLNEIPVEPSEPELEV